MTGKWVESMVASSVKGLAHVIVMKRLSKA